MDNEEVGPTPVPPPEGLVEKVFLSVFMVCVAGCVGVVATVMSMVFAAAFTSLDRPTEDGGDPYHGLLVAIVVGLLTFGLAFAVSLVSMARGAGDFGRRTFSALATLVLMLATVLLGSVIWFVGDVLDRPVLAVAAIASLCGLVPLFWAWAVRRSSVWPWLGAAVVGFALALLAIRA